MGSNIFSRAVVKPGLGDTEGNPTVEIEFAGCYGWAYGVELSERETHMFKQGVLAERERVWDRLADILPKEDVEKIKEEELFNM